MNRQQRYEALPQRDEVIILDSIHNPSYNYNTALPTSIASSSHDGGPPSLPTSPPPSFHTHSSPGTPRPSQSQQAHAQYAELWGVAPSTAGGQTINTSNDALATIAGLKQRVEWLEESIGRLLLEKEEADKNGESQHKMHGDNCCSFFSDVSPDVERALLKSKGNNCCVAYAGSSKSEAKRKEQRFALVALVFVLVVICGTIAIVMTAKSGRVSRAVNQAVDKAIKAME